MGIVVEKLFKSYGDQQAIKDISFSASKGEIVGFLGPNGAGKSTTLKIITGYLSPDSGKATVCGIDVQQNPLGAKRKIGYLPEHNPLYLDMYITEYLSFFAGVHKLNAPKEKINRVIGLIGLETERKKKLSQLSKGYRQRVGLAAALIHSPDVLILDEPTSGLDPNQIIKIRNAIKSEGADKAVLFSSHILQEVEAICDRVLIINKGVLVANDTVDALKKQRNGLQSIKVVFGQPAPHFTLPPQMGELHKIDAVSFTLNTTEADIARKHIWDWSVQYQVPVISLQTESHSLEKVFIELTKVSD